MTDDLYNFVKESNRIEGIMREPTTEEIEATRAFVALRTVTIDDLIALVKVYQPDAVLRDKQGLNVRIGDHFPPKGSYHIPIALKEILRKANSADDDAYTVHCEYEMLHPFTDGNGRSGRALWLWCMRGHAPLGFLHKFYYQALDAYREE